MKELNIQGPLDRHLVADTGYYRDTRRPTAKLWEFMGQPASAVVPASLAIAGYVVPALADLTFVAGGIFTGFVLARRPVLPMRMPAFSRRRDPVFPLHNSKRPGPAKGDMLLFHDRITRQQGWIATEDAKTHIELPGSSNSGKTNSLYVIFANLVAHGSGFIMVDGKGTNATWADTATLMRLYGREGDLRILNMVVASGSRESHTWNPFAHENADAIRNLLMTLFIPEDTGSGAESQKFFTARATDLITVMSDVVVWMRDVYGLPINLPTLRKLTSEFESLILLTPEDGGEIPYPRINYWDNGRREWRMVTLAPETLPDGRRIRVFPERLSSAIRAYMAETGGYSRTKGLDAQSKVREQHSYVVGGFGATYTQLSNTFGHIFDVDDGDINIRDIMFNRRVLHVVLPSLENDQKVNARLGRFVTNAIRYGMAPAIGGQLEGERRRIVDNRISAAHTVFGVALDELPQYASQGADAIAALAREINFMLVLAFQEISSLYAQMGKDRANALLSNPRLKIIHSLEDATSTKEWIESGIPKVQVSVNARWQLGDLSGQYFDPGQADVREMPAFTWRDIVSQKRGQAIITFFGRRVFAQMLDLKLDSGGYLRVPEKLTRAPNYGPGTGDKAAAMSVQTARNAILKGAVALTPEDRTKPAGQIGLLCDAYARAISQDLSPIDEAGVVHDYLAQVLGVPAGRPEAPPPPEKPNQEPPAAASPAAAAPTEAAAPPAAEDHAVAEDDSAGSAVPTPAKEGPVAPFQVLVEAYLRVSGRDPVPFREPTNAPDHEFEASAEA